MLHCVGWQGKSETEDRNEQWTHLVQQDGALRSVRVKQLWRDLFCGSENVTGREGICKESVHDDVESNSIRYMAHA